VHGLDDFGSGKEVKLAPFRDRITLFQAVTNSRELAARSAFTLCRNETCRGITHADFQSFCRDRDCCFRYFNVFVPNQDPSSPYSGVLARPIQQMFNGRQPTILFSDGEQTRDFTYVENIVRANLLAIQVPGRSGRRTRS
jgi:hypothetical protein